MFEREDCDEKDYFDEDSKNKRKAKKAEKEAKMLERANQTISTNFLPSSTKKLLACIHCKLILNKARWIELRKCPNCPRSGGISETSDDFQNIIG